MREMLTESLHIGLRLVEADSRLQPGNYIRTIRDSPITKPGKGVLANWKIHITRLEIPRIVMEVRRNHADRSVGDAIQHDRLPQDTRRGAKSALPQAVANHHDR